MRRLVVRVIHFAEKTADYDRLDIPEFYKNIRKLAQSLTRLP